ncbi:MAG: hypothetical protein IJB15_10255, partial [Clostridia bacterium]|nr:hypothetical protein [Clostridia bacterium]
MQPIAQRGETERIPDKKPGKEFLTLPQGLLCLYRFTGPGAAIGFIEHLFCLVYHKNICLSIGQRKPCARP